MSCWSVYVHLSLPLYVTCWSVYVHVSLPSVYVLFVSVCSCVSSLSICLVGLCMFMCLFPLYVNCWSVYVHVSLPLYMSCWSVYVHVSLSSVCDLLVCVCSCVSSF